MRVFLDYILSFIGSESLTDSEFDAIPSGLTQNYDTQTYGALKIVLQEREGVSGQLKRLNAFYVSKGYDPSVSIQDPTSQIFVGAPI